MPCQADSHCGRNEACVDGECVSTGPEQKRYTFTQAHSAVTQKEQSDINKLTLYGNYLKDDLDDAQYRRRQEAESISSGGLFGQIFGAVVGLVLAVPTGGMSLAAAGAMATSAAIYSGIGSLVGRGLADWAGNAEDYGITAAELAQYDKDDFMFMGEQFGEVHDEYARLQRDIDAYDDNQWKQHVMGAIGDAWTVYRAGNSIASAGNLLAGAFGKDKVVDEAIDIAVDEIDLLEANFDLGNLYDNAKMGGIGWSSALQGGSDYNPPQLTN